VDIASARRERYGMPGALPEVSAASIDLDLGRRDFSVNAMSVALAPSAWGRLLDPFGGERDLAARRLRVLHPLSFVEDPTRIWRGARYAARLGLKPDASFSRALALALRAGAYPALSGQRLRAELDLVMDEPDPWGVLGLLLGWGALRIWDPGFRATRRSRARLSTARRLAAWARGAGVAVDAGRMALVALLFDQPRATAERQDWSSELTWERKTAVVTAGVKRRSRVGPTSSVTRRARSPASMTRARSRAGSSTRDRKRRGN
jgi:tRNA nucleotidyltransferase/poly(A) polymerase